MNSRTSIGFQSQKWKRKEKSGEYIRSIILTLGPAKKLVLIHVRQDILLQCVRIIVKHDFFEFVTNNQKYIIIELEFMLCIGLFFYYVHD